MKMEDLDINIAIVGLGYVGLPLAVEFSKKYNVTGYDINNRRVEELLKSYDKTNSVSQNVLKKLIINKKLEITSDIRSIKSKNIFIVTVPTPVDINKEPDLSILFKATSDIGKILKKDDIVIYESTVYPGCTEEDCVPILEKESGLVYNKDFYCGYSPERINPGDKKNPLNKIVKVTSGSNNKIGRYVDSLYSSIIDAGTHLASSIKVAEASKAIENAQRDLNISFMNELSLIFDRMGIDTNEVIDAASTKWNFLKYSPGLVGGHCISVDPYYLTYKSKKLGYTPKVILSGREVNDQMAEFVAFKVISLMKGNDIKIKGSNSLILGVTFKENMSDIRNSKVVDIYNILIEHGLIVDLYDPYANKDEVLSEFNIETIKDFKKYDSIIIAVAHDEFKKLKFKSLKKSDRTIIYDIKGILKKSQINGRL
tara:strand:+ start:5151 stop:6428 length:1278 start_codon:yes stop_codon:yes gene_type:complete